MVRKKLFFYFLSLEFSYSRSLLGDLKPMNIVYESISGWKLVDLDSCSRVGIDSIGFKASSAYVPPEMIYTYTVHKPDSESRREGA